MDVSQVIYHWLDETRDPIAKWGKPHLILFGEIKKCDILNNIINVVHTVQYSISELF